MDTKALRQKILDLAIRGKLVPQDPNDEPASVLLERIRAEKQQMVKDGKLKAKDIKNDTVIFLGDDNLHYEKFPDGSMKCIEDEIPFELPQGWEWCRLRNISSIISKGTTPKAGKNAYIDGDIGFVRIENLTDNYSISHEDMKYISNTTHSNELKRSILQEHDLLITIAGTLGKTAVVRKENLPLNTNQAIAFIRFIDFEAINILFYCLIISSNTIKNRLLLQTKVTSIPNLTLEIISNCLIPLPPSHEQHRIVAKINELFVFVNTIESDKTDLQTTIQLTKSKILDLAIRGKLVKQNPDDEPASVLLDRIRAEKEGLIKQGKIKRDKKESVIFKGDDNSYYLKTRNLKETLDDWQIDDIPETWGLCCLGEVCDYGNCTNIDTKDIPENAWILDLEDIEKDTGKILQKLTKKERNSASTKHLFYKNQVLYSKLRPYLNKVVLADDNGYCTSEILPLNFNSCILPEYAKHYLMSPTFLRYANHCSYGVKMPRLGTQDGKKAVLTIPPINEQKRIADKVSQLFSLLDSIANNID